MDLGRWTARSDSLRAGLGGCPHMTRIAAEEIPTSRKRREKWGTRQPAPYLVSRLERIVSTESRNSNRVTELYNPDCALAAPAAVSTRMATTPISGERVLTLRFMASVAYVASPISRLVSLEVVEALRPALRPRSSVTVTRIKPVIDMSVKAVRAVKPRACSKKYPAHKPIRPVVAVRSTVIGLIVEVSVRTHGSGADVYANGNLSWRHRYRG